MIEKKPQRRNFLKFLGLSATATLISKNSIAAFVDPTEIRKLNPVQKEFMNQYGHWMDEFLKVIKLQKTEPENLENQRKMVELTEQAEKFKPRLSEFMKDETFAYIYKLAIQRVSDEIT